MLISCFSFLLGLDYIHHQKLVRRDIKPDNVLISTPIAGQEAVKWADYGLSKITTSRGVMSGSKGTENYWAPEIFFLVRKKDSSIDDMQIDIKITKMSDVLACGCVFYWFIPGAFIHLVLIIAVSSSIFVNLILK